MKDYIRNIAVLLFFCLSLAFPVKVYDAFIEYDRLKKYYPKMRPSTFALIHEYSKLHNLTEDQVCAVITSESNWNPMAISVAYARGLMQIMPCHYKGNSNDLFNEELNIALGTEYFRWCLDYAKGDMRNALKFYNAGPYVKQYTNWKYVNTIMNNNQNTKKLISQYDMEIE